MSTSSLSHEELEAMKSRFKTVCNAELERKRTEDFFIQAILAESQSQSQSQSQSNMDIETLINKLDEDIKINQDDKIKINKKLEDISIIKS
jgi:hypothetical protein